MKSRVMRSWVQGGEDRHLSSAQVLGGAWPEGIVTRVTSRGAVTSTEIRVRQGSTSFLLT